MQMDRFFPAHTELEIGVNPIGKFYLPTDAPKDRVLHEIRYGSIYQEEIIRSLGESLLPGDTVIDLGANVGQMSVYASKRVGPTGTVISIEADPYMSYVLNKNILLNKAYNCKVFSAAAWDKSGEYLPYPDPDLRRFDSLGSYGITPKSTTSRKVPSLAIDDLELKQVRFVKIDIQGSDLKALQGMKDTIHRCSPFIIMEYESIFDKDFSSSWEDYLSFFEDIGYVISGWPTPDNFFLRRRIGSDEKNVSQ